MYPKILKYTKKLVKMYKISSIEILLGKENIKYNIYSLSIFVLSCSLSSLVGWWGCFLVITVSHPTLSCVVVEVGVGL